LTPDQGVPGRGRLMTSWHHPQAGQGP
jgi:hypothetical protein